MLVHQFDTWDENLWMNRAVELSKRLKKLCVQFNIEYCYKGFGKKLECLIENKTGYEKIVYFQLFDQIPYQFELDHLDNLCQLKGKKIFIISDNLSFYKDYQNITIYNTKELLGIIAVYNNDFLENSNPSKLYSCFNQRVCPVRQSWLYFLHNNKLLSKGHVSYFVEDIEVFSDMHYSSGLQNLEHFHNAFLELQNQVPYKNFKETGDLLPLMLDAKYALEFQTCCVDDDQDLFNITEKILRSLQMPVNQLLFVQKGTCSVLKNLGFELPDQLFKLDNMCWQDRQQQLLKILTNDIMPWNPKQNRERALHNRSILEHYRNTYEKTDYFDSIFEEIVQV